MGIIKNKKSVALNVSVIANIFLLFCTSVLTLNKIGVLTMATLSGGYSYLSNPQYNAYESMFELYKGKADIVFAGDSYTARGHFDELMKLISDPSDTRSSVLNRGIGSDTSEGLYNRIDEIISHNPSKLFILIGANDIGKGVPVEDTLHFYRLTIEKIKGDLPNCEIYMQSVFPTSSKLLINNNEKIKALNQALEQLANEQKCVWIDIHSNFFDGEGNLIEEYISGDGVHLTGQGYKAWIDAISRYVIQRRFQ